MDSTLPSDADLQLARSVLASYSDLHDARLVTLRLDENRNLTMRFFAEWYETGDVAAIIVLSGGVRDLRIMPPRSGALGFEDFAFPLNTSIDHIVRRRSARDINQAEIDAPRIIEEALGRVCLTATQRSSDGR